MINVGIYINTSYEKCNLPAKPSMFYYTLMEYCPLSFYLLSDGEDLYCFLHKILAFLVLIYQELMKVLSLIVVYYILVYWCIDTTRLL